ncbi:MAG: hypothetical protein RMZ43_012945 [Nostoc sp. CmiVER01]|nr:hypothetical protein [Nostoc sp. CmiVER01]MDZ8125062.1 hypothetical protein [Nostoc sp. CmiVER01]
MNKKQFEQTGRAIALQKIVKTPIGQQLSKLKPTTRNHCGTV